MKLAAKDKIIQHNIANVLKKGLPLAGLLTSLLVTTGCDLFKKSSDDSPTAGYISEPAPAQVATQEKTAQEKVAQEKTEESASQTSDDKQPKSTARQGNNVSEAKSTETPWITTGAPKLPIVPNINNEVMQDFNNLIKENIRTTKDANDAIENSIRASKMTSNPE